MQELTRPTAIIQRVITYFNGFVFISFVFYYLFRNLKVASSVVYFSLGISGSYLLFFYKYAFECGSYTGLIMIVGIISENAILPIYSLKRHLLVRMIKAIASLCNLNAFKTEIDDCFRCHYCIITFSDWNRYGFRVASTLAIAVIGVLIAMPLLLIVLPSCIILISNKRVLSNRRFHLFIVFEMEK
jgi:hypothetical protein